MPLHVNKTWDDQRLKRDRLARLQEQMKQRDIQALYLTDRITVRYVLNEQIPAGEAFVTAQGEVLGIVRPRDMGYVQLHHANVRLPFHRPEGIREGTMPGEADRFTRGVMELMEEHGVAGERLGVDGLSTAALLALTQAGIAVVDAAPVWQHAQSVKTQDEVAIYRSMAEQYAYTIGVFRDALRPGRSEKELTHLAVSAWYEAEGEDLLQINVCAGENMNPWRRWPTQRTLKDGEFVGIDLHGTGTNGLNGDGSRTFFVGDRPTAEHRDLYRRAYEYLQETIDAFQAGRSFAEILEAVPPVPEKYQTLLHHFDVGHGVGMSFPGFPHIGVGRDGPSLDHVLEPDQVLAIECYFGEEGSPLAVKLEEQIVPRQGAPEVLGADIPFDDRFVP